MSKFISSFHQGYVSEEELLAKPRFIYSEHHTAGLLFGVKWYSGEKQFGYMIKCGQWLLPEKRQLIEERWHDRIARFRWLLEKVLFRLPFRLSNWLIGFLLTIPKDLRKCQHDH